MKKRLVVMNGTRIVQTQGADGGWQNSRVEKAGSLKPGVYSLYLATPPDQSKAYDGVILHADKDSVYQQISKSQFIRHNREDFDKVPEIGTMKNVAYANGLAVVSATSAKLSRGVSR